MRDWTVKGGKHFQEGSAVLRNFPGYVFEALAGLHKKTPSNLTLFNVRAIEPRGVHPFDTPYPPSGQEI